MTHTIVQERLKRAEGWLLTGHILSMGFGLAGLLLVLPNPEFVARLPEFGQRAFAWSMAGGGVVYMLLGMAAVAIYAYRTLGLWHWLGFMIPALCLSLGSELLGTSTGFPFGHYRYLSGLGYKIAGLVPFTIPLSWFYIGFSTYSIARVGLPAAKFQTGCDLQGRSRLDRLGRSLKDLICIIEGLERRKIELHSLQESMATHEDEGKLIFH